MSRSRVTFQNAFRSCNPYVCTMVHVSEVLEDVKLLCVQTDKYARDSLKISTNFPNQFIRLYMEIMNQNDQFFCDQKDSLIRPSSIPFPPLDGKFMKSPSPLRLRQINFSCHPLIKEMVKELKDLWDYRRRDF